MRESVCPLSSKEVESESLKPVIRGELMTLKVNEFEYEFPKSLDSFTK